MSVHTEDKNYTLVRSDSFRGEPTGPFTEPVDLWKFLLYFFYYIFTIFLSLSK